MNHADIVAELFRLQDKEYGTFQSKLIPSVSAERVIGVRTPELRALAKRLYQDGQQGGACGAELEAFLASLPHDPVDLTLFKIQLVGFHLIYTMTSTRIL